MRCRWKIALSSIAAAASALLALSRPNAAAQEVVPYHQDAPPNAPRSPEEAIRHMTVPSGFVVELVAAEPDLVNPVAMTFDPRGRIWVTESLEYPRSEPGPGRDRIKILEDQDGDGRAESVTIFADGLNIPSGIALGYGGAIVANAPDLLFLKDTDGDGRADERRVLLTGFGRSDTHELPNSLAWGPDGWLYGLNGVFNHSSVEFPPGTHHKFNCAVWRYHFTQRRFELFAEGTSNPWGLAFDPRGEMFLSACVIDHLWHISPGGYYHRQAGPYPPFTWKIESIVDHAHQKAAYCGLCWFDSDAYPAEYRGRLYMGNIHGNCINVDVVEQRGSTYVAHAAPDYLSAHDAWFMPVSQKVGPDGCLYVLDWYDRYHCYQDARRDPEGIDRLKGRLYRVRYGDAPRRAAEDLTKLKPAELVDRLGDPNVYVRETVQRLLAEREHDIDVVHLVEETALAREAPKSRELAQTHALYSRLSMTAPLSAEMAQRLLDHPNANVRKWGVRAVANGQLRFSAPDTPRINELWPPLVALLKQETAPEVQLQLVDALRHASATDATLQAYATLLDNCGNDPVIPRVIWSHLHSLLPGRGDRWAELTAERPLSAPAWQDVLPRSIERLAAAQPPPAASIARILARLSTGPEDPAQPALAAQCWQALHQSRHVASLDDAAAAALRKELLPLLDTSLQRPPGAAPLADAVILAAAWGHERGRELAMRLIDDAQTPEPTRLAAWQALVTARDKRLLDRLPQRLSAGAAHSSGQRRQMLAVLGSWEEPQIGTAVTTALPDLEPELQPAAIELLTQRKVWGEALVAAVEAKTISPAAINVNQLRKLLAAADAPLRDRITAVWGAVRKERDPGRDLVIRRTTELLESNHGDAGAGQAVFRKVCAQCHKLYGEGQEVGPDLTANGRNSFVQLMSNVLDPSLVIGKDYQARTVATVEGRTLVGLVVEEDADRLVLKLQGGKLETLSRDQIEQSETSRLSMMPDNLETQVTPRELVDLLTFLALDKPPADANAKLLPDFPRPGQDAD